MKILMIEDNEAQGKIGKQMLELMGQHEVKLVVDGTTALATAKQADWQPDVIITDRRLPDMTGADIITQFKEEPSLADVPIIMLSADVMSKAKDEAIDAGAHSFFAKPVDYMELNEFLKGLG